MAKETEVVSEAKTEKDRVVSHQVSAQGEFSVLLASGRLFKRERDPKNFDPGVHMIWTEIPTADIPR